MENEDSPAGQREDAVDGVSEGLSPAKAGWSAKAKTLASWAKRAGSAAMDSVRDAAGTTADKVSDATEEMVAGATIVVDRAGAEYARRLGEDEAQIVRDCPVVVQLIDQQEAYLSDPDVMGLLQNVRLKPLIGAAVLAGTGVGVVMHDELLSRTTRAIFDGKAYAGGWLQDAVAGFVGADTVTSVNRFVDTVPGSGVMGGGWIHRIQHGHDLSAVAEVWGDHGPAGGIQALYHIYGRDFFTPAGIPILPTGSHAVHQQFLEMGMTSKQAADWLSINFVELLGSGVAIFGVIRLLQACQAAREDARIRALSQKATVALESEDFLTARDAIDEAVARRPTDGELAFLRAMIHQRSESVIEAHDAYRQAARLMVESDPGLTLGGAEISFRGLSGIGALATVSAVARVKEYEAVWLDRVKEVARASSDAFEQMAHKLTDRRFIRRWGAKSLLPPRYFSAALNYRFAGQVVGQSLVLPDRESRLERIATRMNECWDALRQERDLGDARPTIDYLQDVTSSELAALPAEPTREVRAAENPSDSEA
jgi:hypothetical protein